MGESTRSNVPVKVIAVAIARIVVIFGLLLTAYLFVPIKRDSPLISGVIWSVLIALLLLLGFFALQTHRINRSKHPLLAGAESLIIVVATFVIGFAFIYLVMSTHAPETFSEPLIRTGAMYFAIAVLSTVGCGDITPKSDPSRWLVAAQMLIDIGFIAGGVRLLASIARRADRRNREADAASE